VFAEPRNGAAFVEWDPTTGTFDGFRVTASPGGKTAVTNAQSVTVTGLTNGTKYTFTVKTMSKGATSAPSAPSPAITVGAPGKFRGNLHAGDEKMELICDSGGQLSNGSAITEMKMLWKDTGAVYSLPVDGCDVILKNLVNGKSYFAEITLKNARGTSPVKTQSGVPRDSFIDTVTPSTGATVARGGTQRVGYFSPYALPSDRLKIELLKTGVLRSTVITTSATRDGYNWLVPARMETGQYRLRVTNLDTVESDTTATGGTFTVT
jgi:hypothetical protein